MQIHLRMLATVIDLGFCQVLHVCAWYKISDGMKGLHIYISMECQSHTIYDTYLHDCLKFR